MRTERRFRERTRLAPTGNERTFVLCSVGQSQFAIPVEFVRQIVAPQKLTAVPEHSELVLGAIEYRGSVVPIVDVARGLGLGPVPPTGKEKWILLSHEGRTFGVLVSQVHDVIRVAESLFRQSLRDQNAGVLTSDEVFTHRDTIVFIVSVPRIAQLSFPSPPALVSK
ncbi:MAG: hypothetical protein B6A08_09860 [Sorangiineae bacterium NIC37A_2]|jgi:purine-binding chemotaxis protein CheW|nr:MAG: hypothetical protein B6A08_09860 [Sorangiineae bacterium NIC37A_2]